MLPDPETYPKDIYILQETQIRDFPYYGQEPICQRRVTTYKKEFSFNTWKWVTIDVQIY